MTRSWVERSLKLSETIYTFNKIDISLAASENGALYSALKRGFIGAFDIRMSVFE